MCACASADRWRDLPNLGTLRLCCSEPCEAAAVSGDTVACALSDAHRVSKVPLDGDKSPMELEMPSRCLLPIVIALEIKKEIKKEDRIYGEPKLASSRPAVR